MNGGFITAHNRCDDLPSVGRGLTRLQAVSRVTQSSVLSSARAKRSNSSSISGALMTSGGDSVTTSPITERTIKPSSSREADGGRADAVLRIERTLARLVGDQFQAADEPEPARFADQRMLAERFEPRLE